MVTDFEVWVPLNGFCWEGEVFSNFSGLELRRMRKKPKLRGVYDMLGPEERADLDSATHWLRFNWRESDKLHSADVIGLFLLSLWLAKPTKTNVSLRFEFVAGRKWFNNKKGWRMPDRFNWVPGYVEEEVSESDLEAAAIYFSVMRDIWLEGKRLLSALLLTFAGCLSSRWQVALISFSAASEAMLTYSTGQGITKRLAAAYSCLVASDQVGQDHAYSEFLRLYGLRSEVMHGRAYRLGSADRKTAVGDFGTLLRRLWKVVLLSPELISVLEGSDEERRDYFQSHRGLPGNSGLNRTAPLRGTAG